MLLRQIPIPLLTSRLKGEEHNDFPPLQPACAKPLRRRQGGGKGGGGDKSNSVLDRVIKVPYIVVRKYTSFNWRIVMATKLTLRMDERVIRRAKTYAKKSGKSVSNLVADFFVLLATGEEKHTFDITPKVKSLRGAFRGARMTTDSYRRHLEDKYL